MKPAAPRGKELKEASSQQPSEELNPANTTWVSLEADPFPVEVRNDHSLIWYPEGSLWSREPS